MMFTKEEQKEISEALAGFKNAELAKNAEYRAEAVQPMVEKLFQISLKLDTLNTLVMAQNDLLMTQNDLLAELIKRTR